MKKYNSPLGYHLITAFHITLKLRDIVSAFIFYNHYIAYPRYWHSASLKSSAGVNKKVETVAF